MRNDELRPRHDAAARLELGCPHFAGMFSLGAALELIEQVGIANIQERALQLNRFLTDKLTENNWKVLSPVQNDGSRSAETLIEIDKPARCGSRSVSSRSYRD